MAKLKNSDLNMTFVEHGKAAQKQEIYKYYCFVFIEKGVPVAICPDMNLAEIGTDMEGDLRKEGGLDLAFTNLQKAMINFSQTRIITYKLGMPEPSPLEKSLKKARKKWKGANMLNYKVVAMQPMY